jgi:adenosine/AMP kinase
MTELVLAVFDAASAADAAVQDLEVAHIPSAVIQRGVRNGPELRDNSSASARPLVIVAVDEMHAAAVTGILNQYDPLEIEERAAQSRRRASAR